MSAEAIDRLREAARNENTVIAMNDLLRLKNSEIEALRAEIEALKQQVEQGKRDAVPEDIRKDAERYRQVRLLALLQKEVDTYDEFDKHTDKFIADELPTTDAAIAAAPKQETKRLLHDAHQDSPTKPASSSL